MAEWSRQNGVKRQNLAKALTGEWRGPVARRFVKKAIETINQEVSI